MSKSSGKPKRGRPATGKTPIRYFRMGDEDWAQVERAAELEGATVSGFVRAALLRAAARRIKK